MLAANGGGPPGESGKSCAMKLVRILLLLALATCATTPTDAPVRDEAMRAGRAGAVSAGARTRTISAAMDGGIALTPGAGAGPQHLAGLDRRR